MEKHTKEYLNLMEYFKEIKAYQKGSTFNVDKIAQLFYFELCNVNIIYQSTHNSLLAGDEYEDVQKFINIITGNRNINKAIRREIMIEAIDFNEMVEMLKSQIKYEVGLSK